MIHYLKLYQLYLLLAVTVLAIGEAVLIGVINSRFNRISTLLRSLFSGPSGGDLDALLKQCLADSQDALRHNKELEERLFALTDTTRGCVQNVGLLRYDAYGDVSGEQSFSLAVLDGRKTGAIITALFGRNESRCYGKAVVDGTAQQSLSEEESAVLDAALTGGISAATSNNGRPSRARPAARR